MTERLMRSSTVVLVVLLALVTAGGVWLYRDQEEHARMRVEAELGAVAELKADELASWRADLLDEGLELAQRPLLAALIERWLREPDLVESRELRDELEAIRSHEAYLDVLLVDAADRVRLSLVGAASQHDDEHVALEAALTRGEPTLTELHAEADGSSIHLSTVVPLYSSAPGDPRPIGAVILVSEARDFLYPLIQSWPTPSETAESLLVRRDGGDVLFLNDLRHQEGAALSLRIPVTREDLPAAMATMGIEGFVEGLDYRGVPVVAALRAVPDSPWFLVAKVDSSEAFSQWRIRAALMVALIVGAAGTVSGILLLRRQRDQKHRFRRLYEAEAERAAEEARHRVTLASIGDAVISTDAGGRVDMLNPVAEALTGWPLEAARGRVLTEIFRITNEETGAEVQSPADRVLREGVVVGLANHTMLVARDGTRRPIADSGAPIRDDDGNIVGVVLVFRDQTEERAAQRESALLNGAIRASHDEIYLFDADTLLFRFMSESALRNLGYSVEESEQLTPLDLKPEFTSESFAALLAPLRDGSASVQAFETAQRRKDGSTYPVEVHVQLFDYPGDAVYLAIARDITEERRVREELSRSEADLKFAQTVAHVGSWTWHIPTGRLEWSDEMYRVFGIEKEGFTGDLGDVVQRAIHPDDREAVERSNRAVMEEASPEPLEYRVVWPDGTVRVVYAEAGRLVTDDAGAPLLLTGIVQDVTHRRQRESEWAELQAQLMQSQKMESVGRLAGGVAHDFNNMLSVILGHTELALEDAEPGSQLRSDLEAVRGAAELSRDLTGQLLAFARRQTVAPKIVDINTSVSAMLKMLHRLIGEDIDLSWKPGRDLGAVEIDPSQLDQILTNLCVNAREAIAGVGKVTIETGNATFDEAYCSTHAECRPGEYVMIGVSDDGCGMEKEVIEHLFEPFFTTDASGRNTGLGLATVYGIVRQNEGFINVYSEPGVGSTFRIYLPRAAGEAVAVAEADAEFAPAGAGETVLVVEDEPAILNVEIRVLEGLGYQVLAALTPTEALEAARTHPGRIDLLLTDVVMPEMNGRLLAEKLRVVRPDIKCLYVSGYTANVIAHRGVLEEGVHFLEKPFSRRSLAIKVREVLRS